jgi:hypothetical protein
MVTPFEQRTDRERAELQAFSKKLNGLLTQRGMRPSDLARAIWGSMTDNRGRNVARNRDRVSHYVHGRQMPEAKTIGKIAAVLGVDPAELVPSLARPEPLNRDRDAPAEMAMVMVSGTSPAMASITLNKILPLTVVTQIMTLVSDAERASRVV